jgi:hypothetical protein
VSAANDSFVIDTLSGPTPARSGTHKIRVGLGLGGRTMVLPRPLPGRDVRA